MFVDTKSLILLPNPNFINIVYIKWALYTLYPNGAPFCDKTFCDVAYTYHMRRFLFCTYLPSLF